MTRIVAGRAGGRRLAVPASGTRPTSDMAREGVFSTLTSLLGDLEGVAFLDLYAGSGAVGLEAWSRGASRVVLVESAPRALQVLRRNVAEVSRGADVGAVTVIGGKVESVVRELPPSAFDVVFADPPYDVTTRSLTAVVKTLCDRGLLGADAIVVVERASRDSWQWPEGIEALRERRYGDATVWYGHAAPIAR